jgi:hypothetical protein
MRGVWTVLVFGISLGLSSAIGGCTAILGDFSLSDQNGGPDGTVPDGGNDAEAGGDDATSEAGDDALADGPNAADGACTPKTCTGLKASCGTPSDGCGGTLQCGTCPSGQTCDTSGQCVCPAGGTPCGSTCVDIQTDNKNCGGCGLACSSTCNAGECLVTLASNVPNAFGIVLNGIKAYVTSYQSNGDIYAVDLGGGGAVDLTLNYHQNEPFGIVVDSASVYWADFQGGTVMKMPLGGNVAPTTIASGQAYPSWMAIDSTNLYWTNQASPGTAMKANRSSLAVSTLVGGINDPFGIAVDSTYAYIALLSDDYVIKVKLSDGSIASQLTSYQNNPYAVAIDSTNVYFTNQVNSGDAHQVAQNASMSAGISLGATSTPGGIATDGTNVYWVGGNTVYKCPVGVAGGGKAIATNQSGASFVAVDATSVYWTNKGAGSVMKLTPK